MKSGLLMIEHRVIFNSHDDVIRWKHFPCYWHFVRGIHWSPGGFPSQRPVMRSIVFFFCVWTNGWANNRDVSNLRRHRARYGVTVMCVIRYIGLVSLFTLKLRFSHARWLIYYYGGVEGYLSTNTIFSCNRGQIMQIRWSWIGLTSIMGIPILHIDRKRAIHG